MRKMKKLVGYLILLAIPVAIAAGLFIFNGSGYRLSEQDAADIAYKNAGVKTSEISQSTVSKARSGLHGSYEISFTTSDNHFEYTIDGQSGSILKHKSDHPTTKDEDDAQKGEEPHVLVMTATPIPRTLALILYGDLDISTINELPPGRQKVDTFAVNHTYDNRLYAFIEKETAKGRQCYIICPMIEENEKLDLRSVLKFTEELQNDRLPSLRVECMHGKLKNNEKQDIMDRFSNGEIDVLVSTTVIEVGVNVPNATLMIIENAERFGLSALHQLRGRVGRGGEKSYCVLVTDSKTKVAKERMTIMCKSNDGFVISEKDLHLRGPGDFFGTRQHGLPEMKIANLYKDINILKDVQSVAIDLYKSDENLEKKENLLLKKRIEELYSEENKKICL